MMEPNDHPSLEATTSSHIELPDVNISKNTDLGESSSSESQGRIPGVATADTVESSMDIEQSVPTVAELRGKSDNEDMARPLSRHGKLLYAVLVLPFLVVGLIVTIVLVITTKEGSSASKSSGGNSLKDIDTTESFAVVVEYLGNHGVSEFPDLIREGSYQNQAAKWMAHEDSELRRVPAASPASKEGYTFMQRYIMALVYFQMGGETWKYDLNFLSEKDTCEWFAWIVGQKGSTAMGARCNQNQLISALIMVGADVKGYFPSEIAKLTSLTIIEMDVNEIRGSVPEAFHKLMSLEHFHLSHNSLTGSLPSYLGTFPNLQTIDVSFNLMEGSLPSELATMDRLRGVALDNNLFAGDIGFWGLWSKATASYKQDKLEYVFLEQNALTGLVETTMIEKLPNLKVLDVSDNQLRGPIPMELFRLSALTTLDLHDNQFTGPLPAGIPGNSALEFLALQKNSLTGKISETIGNLAMLTHLDLSNNKFTDYDTNAISNVGISSLKRLTYLFLSANDFEEEPFPFWIREMTNLEELSLKSLHLDGTIPTWIGELANLVLLDIGGNDLRGSIPSEIGNLAKLQFLIMNRNELTDDIPPELGDLSALRLLYLDNNVLGGDLDMICERPESALSPIMVADCGGVDPEVRCECCMQCCEDTITCNDDNIVPSNDPLWQWGYDRLFYSFGNATAFFLATP